MLFVLLIVSSYSMQLLHILWLHWASIFFTVQFELVPLNILQMTYQSIELWNYYKK